MFNQMSRLYVLIAMFFIPFFVSGAAYLCYHTYQDNHNDRKIHDEFIKNQLNENIP